MWQHLLRYPVRAEPPQAVTLQVRGLKKMTSGLIETWVNQKGKESDFFLDQQAKSHFKWTWGFFWWWQMMLKAWILPSAFDSTKKNQSKREGEWMWKHSGRLILMTSKVTLDYLGATLSDSSVWESSFICWLAVSLACVTLDWTVISWFCDMTHQLCPLLQTRVIPTRHWGEPC